MPMNMKEKKLEINGFYEFTDPRGELGHNKFKGLVVKEHDKFYTIQVHTKGEPYKMSVSKVKLRIDDPEFRIEVNKLD